MPEDIPTVKTEQSAGSKALAGTNLAANLGSASLLAIMVLQQLPDFKAVQNEKLAAINASIVETGRMMQLMRDEMRDARHDLTELRNDSLRARGVKSGAMPEKDK